MKGITIFFDAQSGEELKRVDFIYQPAQSRELNLETSPDGKPVIVNYRIDGESIQDTISLSGMMERRMNIFRMNETPAKSFMIIK